MGKQTLIPTFKMKYSMTLLAGAGLAAAQMIDIPECATECLARGLPEIGCEGSLDVECICSGLEDLMQAQASCFTDSCQADQLMDIQDRALELCNNLLSTTLSVSMPSTSAATTATVTNTVTTSSGMMMPSPTSSGADETATTTETETMTDSETMTGTATESSPESTETEGGDGDNAAGKPAAGLAAVALAIAAAAL